MFWARGVVERGEEEDSFVGFVGAWRIDELHLSLHHNLGFVISHAVVVAESNEHE